MDIETISKELAGFQLRYFKEYEANKKERAKLHARIDILKEGLIGAEANLATRITELWKNLDKTNKLLNKQKELSQKSLLDRLLKR